MKLRHSTVHACIIYIILYSSLQYSCDFKSNVMKNLIHHDYNLISMESMSDAANLNMQSLFIQHFTTI